MSALAKPENILAKVHADWNKNGPESVIRAAQALLKLRTTVTGREFEAIALKELFLARSSAAKLMTIAKNKVLADPKNLGKLPAAWAKLAILCYVPEAELARMIADGRVHPNLTRKETEDFRRKTTANLPDKRPRIGPVAVGRNRGDILIMPGGVNFLTLCRRGIEMEKDGAGTEDVAKRLGLARRAYGWGRDIALLGMRNDLNSDDSAKVRKAITELEGGSLKLSGLYKLVRPIMDRLWGKNYSSNHVLHDNKRADGLKRAFTIIQDACEAAVVLIDIHLGDRDEYINALKQLKGAQSNVRLMIKSIQSQIRLF